MTEAADFRARGEQPGLTQLDVAARAGVEATFVRQLVALGILAETTDQGFSEGDVRRARIVRGLEQGGLPLPALGEAFRRAELALDFVDQPAYERFSSLTETSFRQLGEQTGLPIELLLIIREATGFAHPDGVLAALEMVDGARNVASRIADYARQGEVLVSDDVVAAASPAPGVVFDPIGPVELKGLTEAVSLHVARRAA